MLLLDEINQKGFILIASLPSNDLELAKAAEDGGADAIKVHLNVHHVASESDFGSFLHEKDTLDNIKANTKCLIGIMPGARETTTNVEMDYLSKIGFSFLDIYYKDMPNWMWWLVDFDKMVALDSNYNEQTIKEIEDKGADLIEASIIKKGNYGRPLAEEDLNNYKFIVKNTKLPVIVPTQKKISTSEIKKLIDIGIKGIMIGAIVFGNQKEQIRTITEEFKNKIKEIGK